MIGSHLCIIRTCVDEELAFLFYLSLIYFSYSTNIRCIRSAWLYDVWRQCGGWPYLVAPDVPTDRPCWVSLYGLWGGLYPVYVSGVYPACILCVPYVSHKCPRERLGGADKGGQ